jgi:DNA glycosylase AlkZ-like
MAADRLISRELNRATLSRQLLLDRAPLTATSAIEHLVGLQAQNPLDPYSALWSRLAEFDPADVVEPMTRRELVRVVVMRGTIHLVTADDCLYLRPLMQPVLDAEIARHRDYAALLHDIDLKPVLDAAREVLGQSPHSGPQLRNALAERFPQHDAAALAYACRCYLALVQVPPRGLWGKSAQVSLMTAESWIGRPLVARPSIDVVVERYLRAFGPSSVADVSAWCRLSSMREVLDRIRPKLRSMKGPTGRELFDVDDATHPDPDTPAPPRFLPEYDNVLLSHADRSRFASNDHIAQVFADRGKPGGTVLVDGTVFGQWAITRDTQTRDTKNGDATLTVHHHRQPGRAETDAVTEEGLRFLDFIASGAPAKDVRLSRVPDR